MHIQLYQTFKKSRLKTALQLITFAALFLSIAPRGIAQPFSGGCLATSIDISTGVNHSAGAPYAYSTSSTDVQDHYWRITTVPSNSCSITPTYCASLALNTIATGSGVWAPYTTSTGEWLAFTPNCVYATCPDFFYTISPSGPTPIAAPTRFTRSFYLQTAGTVSVNINTSYGDDVTYMQVDAGATAGSIYTHGPTAPGIVYYSKTTNIPATTATVTLTAGPHTLDIDLYDEAGIVTGLNISGTITAGTAILASDNCYGVSTSNCDTVAIDTVAHITGPTTVCVGDSIILSDTSGCTGGTWSVSPLSIASLSVTTGSTTAITGVSPGVATVSYTTGCGTATYTVTVTGAPASPVISGPLSICAGSPTPYSATPGGGSWAVTSIATLTPTTGSTTTVTGLNPGGLAILTYTATNMCGSSKNAIQIKVEPTPVPSIIANPLPPTQMCVHTSFNVSYNPGTTSSFTSSWSVSPSTGVVAVASLTPTMAKVTAVGLGTAVVTYYVTSGGCTGSVSFTVTVVGPPAPGSISGSSPLCIGSVVPFTDPAPGGVWSSTAPAVASVSAVGVVHGLTTGSTVISYTVTNACGSVAATYSVVVAKCAPRSSSSAGEDNGDNDVAANITLVPNPNKGVFTITGSVFALQDQETLPVEILNMMGQVVYTANADIASGVINKAVVMGNEIPNGIYLLRIKTDNGNQVVRFVLNR